MGGERNLLSREEVLGGLPARRARSLIFLIEREAVRHSAESEVGPMALLGERAAETRELDWIAAFAAAGEGEIRRPSIREVEAAAGRWAELVPASADVRAAVAALLAERHALDRERLAGTRAALGLDTDEVRAAYRRQTGAELEALWTRPGLGERLRWAATAPGRWLETTTPFRAAAALTFLLSMGQSVVIVPIAVATVGVPVAAISILVIGMLALTTTAAIAEAAARNGEIRLRGGFFGRLVTSTLGTAAGEVPALLGIASIVLPTVSTFVGLALVLELAFPMPATAWVIALGVIGVLIPLKRPRATSFGGLMVFGLASTALIAVLSVVVLVEAALAGDLVAPPISPPGDIGVEAALGVIIGVLLASYADPVYAVQIGKLVLPRDPDGAGFARGSIAGMAAFVALTALFSAVLLLAVPASDLSGESGSALDAIAADFGALAVLLATVIGISLFGIRLYGNAIALFDFVEERLPGRPPPRVVLRRRRGRVLLTEPGEAAPALTIAYLGLREGRPALALAGSVAEGERTLGGDAESVGDGSAAARIEVLDATDDQLRLALRTRLEIAYDGDATATGPGIAESLLAEDEGSALAAWLVRKGEGTAAAAARAHGWSAAEARERLERLVSDGRAERRGEGYRARLGTRRGSGLDSAVWERLGEPEAVRSDPGEGGVVERRGAWHRVLASKPLRNLVSSIPTAVLAALSAGLVAAGTASVSGPFRIVGVIAFATISGVLPPLLLVAARRRSEVAGASRAGAVVGPVLLGACALVGFAVLILHATILWEDPIERAVAAVAALFAIAAVVLSQRHGAFRPAMIVELRRDREDGPTTLRAEEAGEPLWVRVSGDGRELPPEGLEVELTGALTIEGRPRSARDLLVSAQRFASTGTAEGLPLRAWLAPRSGADLDADAAVKLGETGGVAKFETGGAWTIRVAPEDDDAQAGGARTKVDSPLDLL